MTTEILAAIKAATGDSRKSVLWNRTRFNAPISSADDYIDWHKGQQERNREKARAYARAYHQKNTDLCHARCSDYAKRNRASIREKARERRNKKTPEQLASEAEKRRQWVARNSERIKESRRRANAKLTPEKRRAKWLKAMANPETKQKAYIRQQQWRRANREKFRATAMRCYRKRQQNPKWVIAGRMRARLYAALKFAKKTEGTFDLVGCTPDQLKFWIESKFMRGMTWDNRSRWHIDHIIPVKAFNLENPEDRKACFHYTNLQPLWRKHNLKKNANIVPFKPVQCDFFIGLPQKVSEL